MALTKVSIPSSLRRRADKPEDVTQSPFHDIQLEHLDRTIAVTNAVLAEVKGDKAQAVLLRRQGYFLGYRSI